MSSVCCPRCGGQASCVDSAGFQWRCYSHGEYTFDVRDMSAEQQRVAATESRGLRAESRANAGLPLLPEGHGQWQVRSFNPGRRDLPFAQDSYESETAALDEYQERAETVAKYGGGCELVTPAGCVQAHISKPLGSG